MKDDHLSPRQTTEAHHISDEQPVVDQQALKSFRDRLQHALAHKRRLTPEEVQQPEASLAQKREQMKNQPLQAMIFLGGIKKPSAWDQTPSPGRDEGDQDPTEQA